MTLQVQFLPTSTGAASGQITISNNSSSGSTAVVALSGTSTVALSPQLAVSAASLSFGSVTVNTATIQSLTLTSTGTSPVTVNSAAITGAGFTIVGGSLPVTLNPTQAVTLQVQFSSHSGWGSQRTDHNQQQFIDGINGGGGPERYKYSGTESSVGDKCCKLEFWQRNGKHGDNTVVDANLDRDVLR